jgi:hypothetical protein
LVAAAISGRCSVSRVPPIPPYVRAMPSGILNDSLNYSPTGCDQILLLRADAFFSST